MYLRVTDGSMKCTSKWLRAGWVEKGKALTALSFWPIELAVTVMTMFLV